MMGKGKKQGAKSREQRAKRSEKVLRCCSAEEKNDA